MKIIYKIVFRPKAAKAFEKLDFSLKKQLSHKLQERQTTPIAPADRLRDMPGCYKIKLRARGIRLIYQVRQVELVILVLSVGKREREEAYRNAAAELAKLDG